jgi:hypothetical protein
VILPDEHFLTPPQVTAMDDQFGTHRLYGKTVHEGGDRAGYCEQGQFAKTDDSPKYQ